LCIVVKNLICVFNLNFALKVLVEGVKIALALAQTKAFESLGSKFWDAIPLPGNDGLRLEVCF